MRLPLACPAFVVFALAWPFAVAHAQDPAPKSPDVMTVNGAQVSAPAAVPDLTDSPRVARRAPRTPEPQPSLRRPTKDAADAMPPGARRATPRAGAPVAPAGSIPALLGPLPRPEWGVAAAPAAPKPADVVTVGEPTGLDAPPAAPSAPPSGAAPAAAKPQRDASTQEPRSATAPPPSAAKPEVKR